MLIATLTTDFGAADYYTAQFKGDLIRTIPTLTIIDLSHEIPAYNIVSGAYALKHTYRHFPAGTVHILRVNEQGIVNEDIIVAYSDGHYFLAPDNGILSLVFYKKPDWIFAVDVEKLNNSKSNEIYAFITKQLLDAGEISLFVKNKTEIVTLSDWAVSKSSHQIRGMVVLVDHFGNLITNIHISDAIDYLRRFEKIVIQYRGKENVQGLVHFYNDVKQGEKLVRFNDEGYLEIAQNQANAAQLMGIKFGDFVNVNFE